ncbi:hypothetical protein D0Y55_30180 [Pseudomonas aeruginosa]|uniref:Uncharacterized protein n=1 Tax=Pseudomonas aeruginosa TaxID=287 RepID=A0A367MBI4_PSEAI|nr:hypothetical protein D0Y56_04565 [Pseudomonas aeruginosa]AXS97108.1 hypothetical protein D0Y57_30115 [Pseudomonas aeruginosa]AXT03600.1 hypothetical protein D0Y55_30180 [Pseudomonas aeruginosa]AXT10088.1 hypothetical protein D0Y58_30215 [Pseudomonas aeruginosa]RCI74738.1 hypothetical protein DT376_11355 [Pseudomonas aeruginosa]
MFFTPIVVTHVSIRTSDTSSKLLNSPSQAYRTLLYRVTYVTPAASVCGLSPVTSSAQADSTSELLRFL